MTKIDANQIVEDILDDYTIDDIAVGIYDDSDDETEDVIDIDPELLDIIEKYVYGINDEFVTMVLKYTPDYDTLQIDDDVDIIYLTDIVAQIICKKIGRII